MQALKLDCAICLNTLESHYIAVHNEQDTPELKHIFHRTCLEGWMERQSICPLCRKNINHLESSDILHEREDRLRAAASIGDTKTVLDILKMGFLTTNAKVDAMCQALFHKKQDTAKALYKNQSHNNYFKELVLQLAAKQGLKQVIQLFNTEQPLLQSERESIVIEASRYGQIEIISYMFELGAISEACVGEACNMAIDHCFSDTVPLIMEHSNIPILARSSACVKLAKRDDYFLIDYLLSTGPILDVSKARVYAYAFFFKRLETIPTITHQVPLLVRGFEEALYLALMEKRLSEAAIYIKEKLIPREILEHFLERLVDYNEVELFKDLLKHTSFSKTLLLDLKERAKARHFETMIQAIDEALSWRLYRLFCQFFH
jgi:RING-H2 zinc finger domain